MSANRFGERFQVVTFGESHGPGLGAVIDGCPAGVPWDGPLLEREMARRRPGQALGSGRAEPDQVEILSGVFEGFTLGTPIAMLTRNVDARSSDYEALRDAPRPGHADDVWLAKFGRRDHRGGGRSSGRETVSRVMAGAVARMLVRCLAPRTAVIGFASSIGPLSLSDGDRARVVSLDEERLDAFPARFPSPSQSGAVVALLERAKAAGQSWGGTAEILVQSPPANLGQPVFHKLKADLAAAMLSTGATAAVEIGAGVSSARAEGTAFHDPRAGAAPYGGIRGGLSTGETLRLAVSFKPTSSVLDVATSGRHDPCIVPRAIPVLGSMVWIVLADHLLWQRQDRV